MKFLQGLCFVAILLFGAWVAAVRIIEWFALHP